MRENELKPCPYCGRKEVKVENWIYSPCYAYVYCDHCFMRGPLELTKGAIHAWNKLPRKKDAVRNLLQRG